MQSTFDIDEVVPKIKESFEGSPRGCQCRFIALNENWGLKLYRRAKDRDISFSRQRDAYEIGLGPEVGHKIDLVGDEMPVGCASSAYKYGYITEMVETIKSQCTEPFFDAWQWAEAHKYEIKPIIKILLDKLGWDFKDYHGENWGYRANGNLVPIDFGDI